MGQPTDGMMVAAVSRVVSGTRMPSTRIPNPDRISGCVIGAVDIFAKVTPHPGDAFAANHIIRINQFVDSRDGGDMSADHDLRSGRDAAHASAHLAHFAEVRNDAGDADDVVFVSR